MRTLIYNIGTLIGVLPEEVLRLQDREMDSVRSIDNAYLVIEDDRIAEFGQQSAELLQNAGHFDNIIDAGHGMVLHSATRILIWSMQDAETVNSGTRSQVFPTRKSPHAAAESSIPQTCSTTHPKKNCTGSLWYGSVKSYQWAREPWK